MAQQSERVFLCVIDDTDELETALHYAARRAKLTNGKVALYYCIERQNLQHWVGIKRIMKQEAEEDAKEYLDKAASYVTSITGKEPLQYIKNGDVINELLKILRDPNEAVSTLILASNASKKEGPGPLITQFISKQAYQMPVPITVIPQNLSKEEIDKLTE